MWTLDDIRIIVTKKDHTLTDQIARLSPIDGGTIHHRFGYDKEIMKFEGYVVGSKAGLIKVLPQTGGPFTLSGPNGLISDNILVKSVQMSLLNTICQTIDPEEDEDAQVYTVALELYEDA